VEPSIIQLTINYRILIALYVETNPRDEELTVISCIFPEEWHAVKQGCEYQVQDNYKLINC
jgi:hypothetical protein